MKTVLHITKLLFIAAFLAATVLAMHANAGNLVKTGIKIMHKEELGSFLVSGNGMTLYSYSKDTANESICVEGCAANWPPFYADPSAAVEGCDSGDFETITRDDGRLQTTYRGMPLYQFINDKYPGDTFGNELGGVWHIVKPVE